MKSRPISAGVSWVGAIDWDRRLFDSLIPLPHGTTYNAYLVQGSSATALLDAVDTSCVPALYEHLADISSIDYLVSHHTEQDHSGAIPFVLEKYRSCTVLATQKGKDMLVDHLRISPDRIRAVADGETLDLGGKTLTFVHAPWQHWPETMMTWLEEDRILFSCDLYGAHMATAELFVEFGKLEKAAKSYYAEIMMPYAKLIRKNLDKALALAPSLIAPSHGPLHREPSLIMKAYDEWVSAPPRNLCVVPYVTMHGSTRELVEHFLCCLAEQGVEAQGYDLTVTELGELATSLVDAASVVVATPTVLTGPHPLAVTACYLANALKPKFKYASVIGSYGWGGTTVNQITALLAGVRPEFLDPVMVKGFPKASDYEAVEALAKAIKEKHEGLE